MSHSRPSFFLITPAYNSAGTITKLIDSVVSQELKPSRWIIVDDGSSDATADIVGMYLEKYEFIQLERLSKDVNVHSFGAKVRALNHALSKLDLNLSDFVGVLDADIELPTDYFSSLFNRMNQDTSLGIAGGYYRPYYDEKFHEYILNPQWSVAGGVQMFRTKCLQSIGSEFISLPYGSEDNAIEIMARSKGWGVKTFDDLPVTHHGWVGGASGFRFKSRYRRGLSYASIGYHPLFLILRCIPRLREAPWLIGSIVEIIGFCVGQIKYNPPLLEPKTVAFLRREQVERILGRK